jgi:hypothetical protein
MSQWTDSTFIRRIALSYIADPAVAPDRALLLGYVDTPNEPPSNIQSTKLHDRLQLGLSGIELRMRSCEKKKGQSSVNQATKDGCEATIRTLIDHRARSYHLKLRYCSVILLCDSGKPKIDKEIETETQSIGKSEQSYQFAVYYFTALEEGYKPILTVFLEKRSDEASKVISESKKTFF